MLLKHFFRVSKYENVKNKLDCFLSYSIYQNNIRKFSNLCLNLNSRSYYSYHNYNRFLSDYSNTIDTYKNTRNELKCNNMKNKKNNIKNVRWLCSKNEPIIESKKPLKQRIIDELIHYKNGTKLFFLDVKLCSRYMRRVLNGRTLSVREKLQVR